MNKKKFLFILGTRPEVIKLAPVFLECQNRPEIEVELLHTGQHKEMAEDMLNIFNIKPNYNLSVMSHNQTLFTLTTKIMAGLEKIVPNNNYDMIFVQGDTTSVFLGALAGFYCKIPVAHVEAGLRTDNRYSPFPEEINRRLTSPLTSLHFAPTERAKKKLLLENTPEKDIYVTGNTVIDALLWNLNRPYEAPDSLKDIFASEKKLILVTAHRRENFGDPHKNVFDAIKHLCNQHEDIEFLFPVHPNPNVRAKVAESLGNNPRIHLTAPLGYLDFTQAMKKSHIILSDSGGVQEEAPTLKKPLLVLRESTERPEGIDSGALKLVGTNKDLIIEETNRLLTDPDYYQSMTKNPNPYGDGKASKRIIDTALNWLTAN
jgi:UDP-N-acetylglucosamine 2-epimerase (non-hydrolysing)